MFFLDRDEKYKEELFEFLQNTSHRNYKTIMHQLAVILGHAEV